MDSPALPGSATGARRRQRLTATAFVTPFFVLFLLMVIVPIGYAGYMSLFREQSNGGLGFGGTETVFVGLENYANTLTDHQFYDGFINLMIYVAVYIPLMIGSALLLAMLVDSSYARAKKFFQLTLFMPHAVPGVIAAIVWLYLYTPGLSPILQFLDTFDVSWNFFGQAEVFGSIANVTVWQWSGYNMIIFFAALQAIPRETVEAATVDGASERQIALRIKIPMIRSAVVLAILFTTIGALQLFTEPNILNQKGGGLGTSWSPMMYIETAATKQHDFGRAAAASLMLAVLIGLLSFIVTRFGRRRSA